MADDLIQRLRHRKDFFKNGARWVMSCGPDPDCTEAADALARKDAEIAELQSQLAALRERVERAPVADPFHAESECDGEQQLIDIADRLGYFTGKRVALVALEE